MLRERIAELASDFASEVIAALKAAPLAELTALTKKPLPPGYDVAGRAPSPPSSTEEEATGTESESVQQELFNEAAAPKTRGRKAGGKTKGAGGKSQGAKAKAAKAAPAPARLDQKRITAALDFFEMRGSKGATAVQVDEHLKASGFEGDVDVVTALVERGDVRDAGIRRATGKGTAAVFVRSDMAAS
ncbi:hypothetical protein [Labilithrix luteola]|nr:hypothetical protein [Labilithrix luteola]